MAKNLPVDNFIAPLEINGLTGRMLHMPAPCGKSAELLLVCGRHSSLERWRELARRIGRYGAVTMADLPGFGGMDSFYTIGKKPSLDNMADYLAAFVKMRYKRRRKVIIVGVSFGFVVATRMLQRNPELARYVEMLISIGGFTHSDELALSNTRRKFYRLAALLCSHRLPAVCFRYVCMNTPVLRFVYRQRDATLSSALDPARRRQNMEVNIWLWQQNDVRTHAYTSAEVVSFNNCQVQVRLPVWHVNAAVDYHSNSHCVEQHLRVIFEQVHIVKAKFAGSAPSAIVDAAAVRTFIPPGLQRILAKL